MNVVLSRSFGENTAGPSNGESTGEYPEDVIKASSLEDAMEKLKDGEWGGGGKLVMEIYPIVTLDMICALHYGDRKQ